MVGQNLMSCRLRGMSLDPENNSVDLLYQPTIVSNFYSFGNMTKQWNSMYNYMYINMYLDTGT